ADLAVAWHEAVVHRHARGAFGCSKGDGGLVEQLPVLHAVAAGEDELGLGHGNLCRVHGHRAEVFDAWQAVSNPCVERQGANFMTGFADRFGALGGGQDQPRQRALNVLLATAGAADGLLAGDLPDARCRAFAKLGGQAPAQFAATGAAIGQQPVARRQLALHGAQGQYAGFRGVPLEGFACDAQQAVDAGRVEGAFLVLAEHHGHHRTAVAGQLAGQAEQVLVMAGEPSTDHVRHHADVEGRLLDDVQRQLHLDAGAAAFAGGALLGTAAVNALDPGRADEAGGDGMWVLADDAVGPHPAGLVLALHGCMKRMQAGAGDPLGARVAADDVAHAWASWMRWDCCFITAPPPVRVWHSGAWPPPRWLRSIPRPPARRCP